MSLDLSSLEDAVGFRGASNGKPLRAPLACFYPDPDQPRTEFDDQSLSELACDIRIRGVMSAINVRLPDTDGRMMIIHGERRWRASRLADASDIPYIVQEDDRLFDGYSQVAENLKRADLTPMELARFLEKQLAAGDSRGEIQRQLGIAASTVTYLLTLTRGPAFIRTLYTQDKCRTPKYLYELAKLAETSPATVEEYCATSDDFSRRAIDALKRKITAAPTLGADDSSNAGEPSNRVVAQSAARGDPGPSRDSRSAAPLKSEGVRMPPEIHGEVEQRPVRVHLDRPVTTAELVHVQFADGTTAEVGLAEVTNLKLFPAAQ